MTLWPRMRRIRFSMAPTWIMGCDMRTLRSEEQVLADRDHHAGR
jgi:hypothetical protein